MARNPCEDEILQQEPVDPEPEPEEGSGEVEDQNEDTPDFAPELPPLPDVPFPMPFLPVRDPEVEGPEMPPVMPPPPRPPYRSAMREVSTIPDSSFITSDIDLKRITEELKLERPINRRGTRRALTATAWFREVPPEMVNTADAFRWSTLSVWNSNLNSEVFQQRFCGPHEDIFNSEVQRGTQQINSSFAGGFPNLHEATILQLYAGSRDRHASPRRYTGPVVEEQNSGEYVILENMRLTLSTMGSQLDDATIMGNRYSAIFDKAFLPQAVQDANLSRKDKLSIFLNAYVYGKSNRETWPQFTRLNPSSTDRNYYKGGLIDFSKKFDDYVFDAPVAFFEEEANNMLMSPFHSAKVEKNVGNVDFVNIRGYESELEVPNIYHYYSSLEMEKKYSNQFNNGQSSLGPVFLSFIQIKDKYNSESRDVEPFTTPSVLKFPSDKVEKLEGINEFMKGYAENYVEISIRTSQKGTINAFLQRNKMDRLLMEVIEPITDPGSLPGVGETQGYVLSDNLNRDTDINTKITSKTTSVLDDSYSGLDNEQNSIARTLNDRTVSGVQTEIRNGFFDILKNHLPESENRDFQRTNKTEYPLLYTGWENVDLLRFEEAIKSQIFITQAEKFIRENKIQRTFADILNGQKAYSEVVGYRVEKHLVNEQGGEELIQTFLLMDSNEVEKINFIDSQIMPFKKYNYKIFTINLVVGTQYQYDRASTATSVPFLDLGIRSRKKIYIINAPFFQQTIETSDMPPMFPQVSFLPYQGEDDRFSILLQQNYGEIKEERIMMGQEGPAGMTHFKTDSLPSAYEWFRLDYAPETYEEFLKGERGIIPATGKTGIISQEVDPNNYYYYTFRAIDNYDFESPDLNKILYSNPTEVYRVRMVSYENGIFMELDPYEMYKKPKESKINFERLLKISPSFDQTIINFENSFNRIANDAAPLPSNSITALRRDLQLIKGNEYVADTNDFQKSAPPVEELSLGVKDNESEKLWTKKFKLRIKSKTTGKAIDLNVVFAQEKKTKPE